MAKKDNKEKALSKRGKKDLAKQKRRFSVSELETALLKKFPRDDAEHWDVMGLTVGEGALEVTRVAITLDPTVDAIRRAASAGANVLLTHHPPYLSGPMKFAPANSVAENPGAGVWAAIQNRISLINFHTALDVSLDAQAVIPNMLGLPMTGKLLEHIPTSKKKGYGAICDLSKSKEGAVSLSQLSARCLSVFGRAPKVWGNMDAQIKTAACALGSAKSLASRVIASGIDCLICGELGYHDSLELSLAGVAIIELGHDASELPLTAVLAKTLADIRFPIDEIVMIDQSNNWSYPEAIRL